MYIIAIGWLWVVLMMALTETSVVAGLLTLVFYGIAPCALLLWLLDTPNRRRRRRAAESAVAGDQFARDPDRSHAKQDQ